MLQRNDGSFPRRELGRRYLASDVKSYTNTPQHPVFVFTCSTHQRRCSHDKFNLNFQRCSGKAQDIQRIGLIELQCFKVLPFSRVWIVLVVEHSGKTHERRKEPT